MKVGSSILINEQPQHGAQSTLSGLRRRSLARQSTGPISENVIQEFKQTLHYGSEAEEWNGPRRRMTKSNSRLSARIREAPSLNVFAPNLRRQVHSLV